MLPPAIAFSRVGVFCIAFAGKSVRPTVLSDGTYATQSSVSEAEKKAEGSEDGIPGLRKLLQKGDFFLGAVISSTLAKLALRTQELHGEACVRKSFVY